MRQVRALFLGGLVMAIGHASAAGQTGRQWTSEDGVLSVTIPQGWIESKDEAIPAMKLSVESPGERTSAVCTVTVNILKGRSQEGANDFATAVVTNKNQAKRTYNEAYVGQIRVAMSVTSLEENGIQNLSLQRFFSISDGDHATGYMILCIVEPKPADTYARTEAFVRSLTIHGETPK